ncbi:DUF4373 domain-containing protein [Bacteroides cellulosilyticus]|jgi:hypothetical protein|uniref:DUF4373 domain-containing protein n=3 Tax=Bacteroides cellulosilyticus TaxID=246787 RepID=A0A412IBZ3_9BACE|nr:DUF4373 domain-containing protein [Bacteroides cellulosilyticus]RGS34397.1 DUF4373 domain-containing protein [Bacteroides cellulosilyticus]
MKRNFYLQHQLMAMHDPRMQNLFDEEGPRGIGTYWIIIEKLSLLPDAKAQLKYLRSSTSKKLSITYIEKIIRNFQLFVLEEDGSFSPEELNPVKKKEKKTAKSDRANDVADAKNDENRQKTAEEKTENSNEKQANTLNTSTDKETSREVFKENIKDITTSAIKEKETAAADDVNFNPIRPWQEVVDGLAVRTPWLEAACIHSGYGELLMRHIKAAVDCFKKHIEVYDKWRNLLSESDARCYFVNFTNPGQRTSQALYATLLALDAKQQSAAPPDPYRYEQRIDGRRTYLGCLIPDNAPPRPDNTAFWNETTNSWRS